MASKTAQYFSQRGMGSGDFLVWRLHCNDLLLRKPIVLNPSVHSAPQSSEIRDARVKTHVISKLIAEDSGCVEKSENSLPLL